jgi:SAM-dependent methyltransferase
MDETRFYERPGLNIELYSERAWKQDIPFYIKHAKRAGGRVLELGSGPGRIAIPLAKAGADVTGLELSPAMIAAAETRRLALEPEVRGRLRFVQGNMANFDLGEDRFALVIIAFRSFQMLLLPEEERACLACIHRHLEPGGRLIIDIFDPLLDMMVPGKVDRDRHVEESERDSYHPETGNRVSVVVEDRTNDTVRQVLEETWRFQEIDHEDRVVREEREVLRMRWLYRYEMRHLLELSGFAIEAEYSDFQESPPAYGKEQIWVARKA